MVTMAAFELGLKWHHLREIGPKIGCFISFTIFNGSKDKSLRHGSLQKGAIRLVCIFPTVQ